MARTLDNFGVPTEGTDGNGVVGILQPKLNYRFRVIVAGFGAGAGANAPKEFTRQVMNVTRPKITHEEVVIDSYNSRMYMMGKHTWDPVTVQLRDDIGNSLTSLVGGQLQAQLNHKNQQGPAAGTDYKFSMIIEILNGNDGTPIEQIQLEGCFLQNVDYSQSDYSSSEPVTISMNIRYDNAVFTDPAIMADDVNYSNNSGLAG